VEDVGGAREGELGEPLTNDRSPASDPAARAIVILMTVLVSARGRPTQERGGGNGTPAGNVDGNVDTDAELELLLHRCVVSSATLRRRWSRCCCGTEANASAVLDAAYWGVGGKGAPDDRAANGGEAEGCAACARVRAAWGQA
jgi:hypothetical protein